LSSAPPKVKKERKEEPQATRGILRFRCPREMG
jgi:hypothetical protein